MTDPSDEREAPSSERDPPRPSDAEPEVTPVDVLEAHPMTEDEEPSELIPRGDRYPPNLFLVQASGVVVFPGLLAPMVVSDEWLDRTLTQALSQSDFIGVAVPRTEGPTGDGPPSPSDLRPVGCLARVVRQMPMPGGGRTVLLQGVHRYRVERTLRTTPYLIAKVSYPDDIVGPDDEAEALSQNVGRLMRQLSEQSGPAGEETLASAVSPELPGPMADFAAAYFVRDAEARADLLESFDVVERLRRANEELLKQHDIADLGQRIEAEIRAKIESHQREFFLREQLKAIRRELGEEVDQRSLDLESFQARIDEGVLPDAVRERAEEDLRRLGVLPSESPEAGVLRGSLEWLLGLPWGVESADDTTLAEARAVLDRDHAGLDEVKERIVEFLAVRQRRPEHSGQILCFAGPPGVGKTSLGRSIAEALGRSFHRISLGGVRDEAEIRGHRRTYVGAMPGRFVRGLKLAGSMNPVFLLDELDKLGQDFRGDPSSALLEVLDPAQNNSFSDHYLEVPLDLSRVFFIATANQVDQIPPALLDRLEVIDLPGYVTEEKVAIARDFLLPHQRDEHGLRKRELSVPVTVLRRVVEEYTREAGVRGLEKALARICRKAVTRLSEPAEDGATPQRLSVSAAALPDYLGPAPFPRTPRPPLPVGTAVGLAWTPVGGEVLEVQVARVPGAKQRSEVTGMLGEVMSESTRIAASYLASQAETLGLPVPFPAEGEGLHVHFPAGAVRKDGPSAGITIATALVSLATHRTVRPGLAMTGELTLTGQVLPVGGIRDKVLAARREGLKEVILPEANRKDVEEIRPDLMKGMRVHFVETYTEVEALAFRRGRSRGAGTSTRSQTSRARGAAPEENRPPWRG